MKTAEDNIVYNNEKRVWAVKPCIIAHINQTLQNV